MNRVGVSGVGSVQSATCRAPAGVSNQNVVAADPTATVVRMNERRVMPM
jgi:hypothetical protein